MIRLVLHTSVLVCASTVSLFITTGCGGSSTGGGSGGSAGAGSGGTGGFIGGGAAGSGSTSAGGAPSNEGTGGIPGTQGGKGGAAGTGGVIDPGGEGDLRDVEELALASDHGCARRQNGTVACWGYNEYGQLGNDTEAISTPMPVTTLGIADATHVAVGKYHSCAARSSTGVACWGNDYWGELGDGNSNTNFRTFVSVIGVTQVQALSLGEFHSCALLPNGTVSCWGAADDGQLGDGIDFTRLFSATPVAVQHLTEILQVTAGGYHNCALDTSRHVWCWGANTFGNLGNGSDATASNVPVLVSNLADVVELKAGTTFTCARYGREGKVACWGRNDFGQLGNGNTQNSNLPVEVPGFDGAVEIAPGVAHVCARKADGRVFCWGNDEVGQLGDGRSGSGVLSLTPVEARFVSQVVQLGAGLNHSCARLASQRVVCWGSGGYGQLGNGSTADSVNAAVGVLAP